MEVTIFDQWWRNHQSLAREGSRMFRFCVVLERCIRTQHQTLFGEIELVQEFITTQNVGHNWWNSSGIFPRIHHNAALQQSPRVHETYWRTRTIAKTNYLHVDVQWHHMEKWKKKKKKQWDGMCWQFHVCVPIRKRFPARHWSLIWSGSETKWYSICIW